MKRTFQVKYYPLYYGKTVKHQQTVSVIITIEETPKSDFFKLIAAKVDELVDQQHPNYAIGDAVRRSLVQTGVIAKIKELPSSNPCQCSKSCGGIELVNQLKNNQ